MSKENTPHISVAPMMDWTDRHFRYFMRIISPHTRLYTEMITTGAILHGDKDRFLRYDKSEHPLALQLGGCDPHDLATCSKIGAEYGYDEINLNCGCPSDRVQKGMIGAILMTKPDLVADCFEAMQQAVDVPVTIKCRIGVDDQDSFEFLCEFVDKIADRGCKTFIIHARKCWLKGLSPKENREIPELDYARVAALKEKYPQASIILNGGITDLETIQSIVHARDEATKPEMKLGKLDGAMIGREAYTNPYFMAEIERKIFGNHDILGREKIARKMIEYAARQQQEHQTPIKSITRHILGLYHHQKGAKAWRRTLSTLHYEKNAGPEVIEKAIQAVDLAHKDRISA
ncbi:MAG: tRNA dihydrouridine(20/20a) synthase DusA [Alphaproteobacteria bacterium]